MTCVEVVQALETRIPPSRAAIFHKSPALSSEQNSKIQHVFSPSRTPSFLGCSFEFRHSSARSRKRWDWAFFGGSLIATFAQGCVLGKFVCRFAVNRRRYTGGSWDWLQPFVLAVGVGLVFGYLLLGATWLVMTTDGALQNWARAQARVGLFGTLAFIAIVSLWTPLLNARIAARWVTWPNLAFLAPIPIATAAIAWSLWFLASPRE